MTQEALKLALEALEQLVARFDCEKFTSICELEPAKDAITAIKEALAQTQEPEPVADDIASILACRDMLDAQPVPLRRTEQEPLIGCVNHDCDQCKAQKACVYCGQLVGKE